MGVMVNVGLGVRLGGGLGEGVIDGSEVGLTSAETYKVSVGFDVVVETCVLGTRFPQATQTKTGKIIAENLLYNFTYHHL